VCGPASISTSRAKVGVTVTVGVVAVSLARLEVDSTAALDTLVYWRRFKLKAKFESSLSYFSFES